MKKYISLLSLVVIAIGWTACSETSNGPGCRIKGYLSFKEYKKVYPVSYTHLRAHET